MKIGREIRSTSSGVVRHSPSSKLCCNWRKPAERTMPDEVTEELGRETSVITNFDWYSPSNARRFSEQEVRALVRDNGMTESYFHAEEACYSGRFAHRPMASSQVLPDGS